MFVAGAFVYKVLRGRSNVAHGGIEGMSLARLEVGFSGLAIKILNVHFQESVPYFYEYFEATNFFHLYRISLLLIIGTVSPWRIA